jgi:hypothetical protein
MNRPIRLSSQAPEKPQAQTVLVNIGIIPKFP